MCHMRMILLKGLPRAKTVSRVKMLESKCYATNCLLQDGVDASLLFLARDGTLCPVGVKLHRPCIAGRKGAVSTGMARFATALGTSHLGCAWHRRQGCTGTGWAGAALQDLTARVVS